MKVSMVGCSTVTATVLENAWPPTGPVAETWKVVLAFNAPVVYVPEQVLPLQELVVSATGSTPFVVSVHAVLPLFGPLKLNCTVPPAGMVVGEALNVMGTMVKVAGEGCEFPALLLAVASKVVVLVGAAVSVKFVACTGNC